MFLLNGSLFREGIRGEVSSLWVQCRTVSLAKEQGCPDFSATGQD